MWEGWRNNFATHEIYITMKTGAFSLKNKSTFVLYYTYINNNKQIKCYRKKKANFRKKHALFYFSFFVFTEGGGVQCMKRLLWQKAFFHPNLYTTAQKTDMEPSLVWCPPHVSLMWDKHRILSMFGRCNCLVSPFLQYKKKNEKNKNHDRKDQMNLDRVFFLLVGPVWGTMLPSMNPYPPNHPPPPPPPPPPPLILPL